MNLAEYYIAYVQGETPEHHLTLATKRGGYSKVPSHGAANAKTVAEWLLSKTEERFKPQGAYAIMSDAKQGILSNANAIVPHIHNACRADIETAFTQPMITDEDTFAWFYREGVGPHVPQLPEQQVIEVRV